MSAADTVHQQLLRIVRGRPVKTIVVDGQEYIRRYYMGTTGDGNDDIWIHRILHPDVRHLHNHPFISRAMVLSGGYLEERVNHAAWRRPTDRVQAGVRETLTHLETEKWSNVVSSCRINGHEISPLDFHRIARLSTTAPTWSVLTVDHRRLPYWYFKEPGKPWEQVPASPRDWWRAYL